MKNHQKNNFQLSQQEFYWALNLFANHNRKEIDFNQLLNLISPVSHLQEIKHILENLNTKLVFKYENEELNFVFYTENDKTQLGVIKIEDEQSKIILINAQQIEMSLSQLKEKQAIIFNFKENISFFDISEKTVEKNFGFKWFIKEMLEYKKLWKNVILWSCLLQAFSFALPLMTQSVVDKVIVNQAQTTLITLSLGVFILNLFTTSFGWARQQLILYMGNEIDNTLANKLFSHLIKLPLNYFQSRNTGNIVSRLHTLETIREFMAGTFITLVLDIPFVLLFAGIMFYYSPLLFFISICFISVMVLLSLLVAPIIRTKAMIQAQISGKNQAFLTEYVANMETIKSLQMENELQKNYRKYFNDYLNTSKDVRSYAIGYNTVMSWLEQTLSLVILAIGAYISMNSTGFTIGMLIAFQMFCSRVTQPILRISGVWQEFQQIQISINRLKDIMNENGEKYSFIKNTLVKDVPDIEFYNLGFKYPHSNWLYKDLNCKIEAGKLLVIKGPSGCGKSTLAKLLQNFYSDYEGFIKIAGVDILKMNVQQLRSLMGVVPQESTLFSGSIYDNFKLVKPDASLEEIAQVCQLAGIDEVIQNLENGYQTNLGEKGAGLSGGQKQRIAIARALLKKPKILIFDEATNGLDPESSRLVINTINSLKGHVTILFITHLENSLLKADGVLNMKRFND